MTRCSKNQQASMVKAGSGLITMHEEMEKHDSKVYQGRKPGANYMTEVLYERITACDVCTYRKNHRLQLYNKDEVEIYDGGWQSNTTK